MATGFPGPVPQMDAHTAGWVCPPVEAVRRAVAAALAEDLTPLGDLSASLVPAEAAGRFAFVARESGVLAGTACAEEVARQVDPELVCTWSSGEGARIAGGQPFGTIDGPVRSILSAERSMLNFLGHLSGIASLTAAYVEAARQGHPEVRVLDTRKTTPGLRALEKAAVRAGGGHNHRGNLSEGVLIKDNHLAVVSIKEAVSSALRRWPGRMVEVECETVDQVREALDAGATVVMCDNMTPEEVRACAGAVRELRARGGNVLLDVSGGVHLDNIEAYAAAGADLISVGALTHSARVLDIGLDAVGS